MWLKADIMKVFITVILPKGVKESFSRSVTVFSR